MNRTITVPGQGTVTVEPNVASVRLGVNVLAKTAKAARETAATTMSRILDALAQQDVARRDIRTSLVSLNPTMDYSDGKGPRITGYQVQNSVAVTVRKLDQTGELIDAALAAGASTLDSLDFRLDDATAAADKARTAAMKDAHERAATIAKAAGGKVGQVLSVQEGEPPSGPAPYPVARMALKAQSAATPVESGSQDVSVSVTVTFALIAGR